MLDDHFQNPSSFDRFSFRVVACGQCRRPRVLLAMGNTEEDQAIKALRKLAPQLRLPAYAIILDASADRARVRKVFPAGGEYVLTAAQWHRLLSTLGGQHICAANSP